MDERQKEYFNSLSDYDKDRYKQLLLKNKKLKEELSIIARATEEIVKKEKERRNKKDELEDDQDILNRQQILREQQGHISTLKHKIERKKRELDEAYQYPLVREKEDHLKDLKRILSELYLERDGAMKIRSEQTKAVNSLGDNREDEIRRRNLNEELLEIKNENKILQEKKQEMDKELNKNHAKLVNGKMYIRELEKKIEEYKSSKKGLSAEARNISQEDIEGLRRTLAELEREKKEKNERHYEDLRNIERMKGELKKDNARLERLLREKDKELRLNAIKMKELRKLQRHRMVRPMRGKRWLTGRGRRGGGRGGEGPGGDHPAAGEGDRGAAAGAEDKDRGRAGGAGGGWGGRGGGWGGPGGGRGEGAGEESGGEAGEGVGGGAEGQEGA
jgi:hypothetical protein